MLVPTRVFVSATSGDLASSRKDVRDALLKLKCAPVEETDFEPDYSTVNESLRRKIASCRAVIHIVGLRYGGEPEPDSLPTGALRRSWTQREYGIARDLRKKVYVFLCQSCFDFDKCPSESAELQERQREYREELCQKKFDSRLWNEVSSRQELRERVREIQFRANAPWELFAAIAALIAVLGCIAWGVSWLMARAKEDAAQRETLNQIQQRYAEQFFEDLLHHSTADEAREKTLEKLPVLMGLPARKVREIIDVRIAAIATDQRSTPLERSRAKLVMGDYDGVLTEAARQRAQNREFEMLAGAAAVAKFRKDPQRKWTEQAAASFQRACSLSDPATDSLGWAEAAIRAAFVLDHLAQFDEAEKLLRLALDRREAALGPNAGELAVVLNNLAQLLKQRCRLAESEALFRRALAINEQSLAPDHPDVASVLVNLASLLCETKRQKQAEPLYRRALAIWEKSKTDDQSEHVVTGVRCLANLLQEEEERQAAAEALYCNALALGETSLSPSHPEVASVLNDLAWFLQEANRRAEAEPLFRRALAIDERSRGIQHFDVAADLNGLAELLRLTNRQAEAELLFRSALAIDNRCFGAEHPNVARDLHSLALLLRDTGRPAEAEALFRHVVAIDERSYGAEHPEVAGDLSTFSKFLRGIKRLREAEILNSRALEIFVLFQTANGFEHRDFRSTRENYLGTLQELEVPQTEIIRRLQAID